MNLHRGALLVGLAELDHLRVPFLEHLPEEGARFRFVREHPRSLEIEILEEVLLPAGPDARPRRLEIGAGEEVEKLEVHVALHALHELEPRVPVLHVPPLAEMREEEMVPHEKRDERARARRDGKRAEERFGHARSGAGVAARAGFPDVVEQRGEEELGPLRDLVVYPRQEPPLAALDLVEVRDRLKGVLVGRVLVVEIVFLEAGELLERREEMPERAELVHAPYHGRLLPRHLEKLDERAAHPLRRAARELRRPERVSHAALHLRREALARAELLLEGEERIVLHPRAAEAQIELAEPLRPHPPVERAVDDPEIPLAGRFVEEAFEERDRWRASSSSSRA